MSDSGWTVVILVAFAALVAFVIIDERRTGRK
jgi:hypothetical protein